MGFNWGFKGLNNLKTCKYMPVSIIYLYMNSALLLHTTKTYCMLIFINPRFLAADKHCLPPFTRKHNKQNKLIQSDILSTGFQFPRYIIIFKKHNSSFCFRFRGEDQNYQLFVISFIYILVIVGLPKFVQRIMIPCFDSCV